MSNITSKPGFVPGVIGGALLFQLALLRLVAWADANRVTFLGQELNWACSFKSRFGFPCLTCGMTRSVLLSLQGQFGEAVRLNPAGLLLVAGLSLFSLTMISLMFYQQRRTSLAVGTVHRYIRIGASVYGSILIGVLFAHWFGEIAAR
jgi:hypothetical protein